METLLKSLYNSMTMSQIYELNFNNIDMTKLDNETLKRICDPSKLTIKDFTKMYNDKLSDEEIIKVFENALKNVSFEDFKLIEFEKISEVLQQKFLGYMLMNCATIDYICVLLDKMISVNYGRFYKPNKSCNFEEINPLICCSNNDSLDLVQLLVEKYKADLEYLSYNNTTAIMFAAQAGNEETFKYLYNKGAKLSTEFHHIKEYVCPSGWINKFIISLEAEEAEKKAKKPNSETQKKSNNEKETDIQNKTNEDNVNSYDILKLELENMRRSYENALSLLQKQDNTNLVTALLQKI